MPRLVSANVLYFILFCSILHIFLVWMSVNLLDGILFLRILAYVNETSVYLKPLRKIHQESFFFSFYTLKVSYKFLKSVQRNMTKSFQ